MTSRAWTHVAWETARTTKGRCIDEIMLGSVMYDWSKGISKYNEMSCTSVLSPWLPAHNRAESNPLQVSFIPFRDDDSNRKIDFVELINPIKTDDWARHQLARNTCPRRGRRGGSAIVIRAMEAWICTHPRTYTHTQANISPASVLGHHVNGALVLAYRLHAYPDGSPARMQR